MTDVALHGEPERLQSPGGEKSLNARQCGALLLSIAVVALCGIVYELIISTVSSYLLGDSVYQFSITIGLFMFAMGIGSYLSKFIIQNLVERFIAVEIVLGLVGGVCSIALFFAFPLTPFLYQTVMLLFILAIGTLVGLEIPLLTRILAEIGGTRRSIANVMSLDYVGALAGSVAFPLFLLPSLGLVRASFAVGMANLAVAFLTVIWLRGAIGSSRLYLAAIGAAFAILLALTIAGSRLTAHAYQHLFFDQVILREQSPYQSLVVTRNWRQDDLRLFIDGHLQFSQRDEHRYHEALVHPVMAYPGRAETILILGGGDGLAAREVLGYASVRHVDLVDIDPEMTDMARTFPPLRHLNQGSLDDGRLQVHNVDAFVFVRRPGRLYDRVILDFPDPHNEAINKLYSREFYQMLSARMDPAAVLVTQASSPFFARRTYWGIAATLEDVFETVESFHITVPSFGIWGFHLAAGEPEITPGPLPAATRFITDETFAAARVFAADIRRPGAMSVNTLVEPTLYRLYLDDMNAPLTVASQPGASFDVAAKDATNR